MGEFELEDPDSVEGTNWLNIAWNLPKGRDLRERITKLRREIHEREKSLQSCREMLDQARADIIFNREEYKAATNNIALLQTETKGMEKVLRGKSLLPEHPVASRWARREREARR